MSTLEELRRKAGLPSAAPVIKEAPARKRRPMTEREALAKGYELVAPSHVVRSVAQPAPPEPEAASGQVLLTDGTRQITLSREELDLALEVASYPDLVDKAADAAFNRNVVKALEAERPATVRVRYDGDGRFAGVSW
jgi:hypothetical protein